MPKTIELACICGVAGCKQTLTIALKERGLLLLESRHGIVVDPQTLINAIYELKLERRDNK